MASHQSIKSKNCVKYIQEHIKKRECHTFVSQDDPLLANPLCECNNKLAEHRPNITRNEQDCQWHWQKHTEQLQTDAFGEIDFVDFDFGDSKPFVRVAEDTDPNFIKTLMTTHWNLEKPNLIISVTGGAKSFFVSNRLRKKFEKALMKAASSTGAWVLTGGMNEGVMKYVGEAVRDYGYLSSGRQVPTIGIAPWGCVRTNKQLINKEHGKPVKYQFSHPNHRDHKSNLDSNHSHFILVDNGTTSQRGVDIAFRTKLEASFKVPVCLLVLEGGRGTLDNFYSAISHEIPAVIVKGSGRVADIIAYAYENIEIEEILVNDEKGGQETYKLPRFSKNVKDNLKDMIIKTKDLDENNLCTYMRQIEAVCNHHDLLSVFEVDSSKTENDLDMAILNAILKVHTDPIHQLQLAISWDRADVARNKIIEDTALKDSPDLYNLMEEAFKSNKPEFVKLFFSQHVDLAKFLTVRRLTSLYNSAPQNSIFSRILSKTHSKCRACSSWRDRHQEQGSEFKLTYLCDIIKLLTNYDYLPKYRYASNEDESHMESPLEELFLWAILMGYSEMSKIFWSEGKEQVASALVASCLFEYMKQFTHDNEKRLELQASSNDYTNLAVGVINECYKNDELYTNKILKRVMKNWGNVTITEIALQSSNREFIASSACQEMAEKIWMHPLKPDVNLWKVLSAILCPPYIWWIIKREELDKICSKSDDVSPNSKNDMILMTPLNDGHNNASAAPLNAHDQLNEDIPRKSGSCCCLINPCDCLRVISKFYNCTRVKLCLDLFFYMTFLMLYAYILLVVLDENVHMMEWILIAWGFSFFAKEIRELIQINTQSCKNRVHRHIGNNWNCFDIGVIVTWLIAFIIRWIPALQDENFVWVRCAYSINFNMFFFRILSRFSASEYLGPVVTMVQNMIYDIRSIIIFLLMFVLSYAITSEAILFPNSELSWLNMYHWPRKAYWGVYGNLFLDELEGTQDCTTNKTSYSDRSMARCPTDVGKYLVPIMLAVYIIMTNVLLLNLLIAMFNDTYQRVKGKSTQHWAFLRFHLIKEYSLRPSLPPPLQIFQHIYRLCWPCREKESDSLFRLDVCLENDLRKLVHWENVIADEFTKRTEMTENQNKITQEELLAELQDKSNSLKDLQKQIETTGLVNKQIDEKLDKKLDTKLDELIKMIEKMNPANNDDIESEEDTLEDDFSKELLNNNSRRSPYLDTLVERFLVKDSQVKWHVPFNKYKPVNFTELDERPYKDIDLEELDESERNLRFNELDESNQVDRRGLVGSYELVKGIPLNPIGRTGMTGRGKLYRWGPNKAWDPVITRWKREKNNQKIVNKDGRGVLEFLAILQNDTKFWSLPGGLQKYGQDDFDMLKVDFQKKGFGSEESKKTVIDQLKKLKKEKIYSGYSDDMRNTDNAWIETKVELFHDETGEIFKDVKIKAGVKSRFATWITLTSEMQLWGAQIHFLKLVAKRKKAYFS